MLATASLIGHCRPLPLVTLAIMASIIVLAGCGKESDAGSSPPASVPSNRAEVRDSQQKPAAVFEEAAFSLRISGPSNLTVGEKREYSVVLRPGAGYKINQEYPHKLKVAVGEGLSTARELVRKPEATIEKSAAQFPLEVVGEARGTANVGGELAFSVCTEERCLIERRRLALPVEVK